MDEVMKFTRDDARAIFSDAGFKNQQLTKSDVEKLRDRINKHLAAGKFFYRCDSKIKIGEPGSGLEFAITCSCDYFDQREAVTFYSVDDSLGIGFAGWADDKNVRPILNAFSYWAIDLISERMKQASDTYSRRNVLKTVLRGRGNAASE